MLPPPALPGFPTRGGYSQGPAGPLNPALGPSAYSSAFANARFGPSSSGGGPHGAPPITTGGSATSPTAAAPAGATTAATIGPDSMTNQLSVRMPSTVLPMLPESTSSLDIANIAASFPPIITLPDRADSTGMAIPLPMPHTQSSGDLNLSAAQWQPYIQAQMQAGGSMAGLQMGTHSGLQVGTHLGLQQPGAGNQSSVQGVTTQAFMPPAGCQPMGALHGLQHSGVGAHSGQQQQPAMGAHQATQPTAAAAVPAAPKGVKRQSAGGRKSGGASRKASKASDQRTPGSSRAADHANIEISRIRVTPQAGSQGEPDWQTFSPGLHDVDHVQQNYADC